MIVFSNIIRILNANYMKKKSFGRNEGNGAFYGGEKSFTENFVINYI